MKRGYVTGGAIGGAVAAYVLLLRLPAPVGRDRPGDIHSADHIVPAWQGVVAGDEVKLAPEVPLHVAAIDPGRSLVLRGCVPRGDTPPPTTSPGPSCSMSRRTGRHGCWCGSDTGTPDGGPFLVEPVAVISFVMIQKMLRGIRNRAEWEAVRSAATAPPDRQ
jgi:hypothetical protein